MEAGRKGLAVAVVAAVAMMSSPCMQILGLAGGLRKGRSQHQPHTVTVARHHRAQAFFHLAGRAMPHSPGDRPFGLQKRTPDPFGANHLRGMCGPTVFYFNIYIFSRLLLPGVCYASASCWLWMYVCIAPFSTLFILSMYVLYLSYISPLVSLLRDPVSSNIHMAQ